MESIGSHQMYPTIVTHQLPQHVRTVVIQDIPITEHHVQPQVLDTMHYDMEILLKQPVLQETTNQVLHKQVV